MGEFYPTIHSAITRCRRGFRKNLSPRRRLRSRLRRSRGGRAWRQIERSRFFKRDDRDCAEYVSSYRIPRRGRPDLPFTDASFDRVLANFALLHLSDPERACAEACRVLRPGGKFGFTIWAPPGESLYAKIIDDAINEHADLNVDLPSGPPHYLFSGRKEFRRALARAGFDGASMIFKLHTIEWRVPTARYIFDAERDAGVRTAGLLARQPPENLRAIQSAIEASVRRYAKGDGFSIPKAAFVVAVAKSRGDR